MKSKLIIAFVLLLAVIFLSGCLKETLLKRNMDSCAKIQNEDDKDSCYYALAKSSKEAKICEVIMDKSKSGYKSLCYKDVGIATANISLCELVESSRYAMGVRDECYAGVGFQLKDLGICDKIGDETIKSNCYYDVASAEKDSSICSKIWDQDINVGEVSADTTGSTNS